MRRFSNYLMLLSDDLRIVGMGQFFRNLMLENNIGPKVLSERLGTPIRSLMNYLSDSRSIPIATCKNILKVIKKDDFDGAFDEFYSKARFITSISSKAETVTIIKSVDKDFAYIIGALHDGCVFSNPKKNQFIVQYVQHSNELWLKIIAKILQKYFGTKPNHYDGYIQISNKYVFEFFSKILSINRQTEWQSFLKGFDWKLQRYLIAGMFDAEGWCSKNDLRLKFSQKNYSKLEELRDVLNKNHIHTGKIVEENNSHALYICGRNFFDFYNKIGKLSKHSSRIVRLRNTKALFC